LIRDKKVCFKGNNLPLGIVDNISVNLQEVEIQKDDILVMASDGVEDKRFIGLELVKMSNLQKASEKIIGKEEVKDDKTVFVIKIC
jgi:serine phosphatase RsbU (regulator of sigma subunit)